MKHSSDIPKTSEKKKKRVRTHGYLEIQERRQAAIAFSGDMKDWRSTVPGKDKF